MKMHAMKSPPGACLHVAFGLLVVLALWLLFGKPASADKKHPAPAARPAPATTASPTKKEQTYNFGGLDIDGKLKTPQLLYFLNRMKSEFDTTTPDKRSFIPELKRSTEEM